MDPVERFFQSGLKLSHLRLLTLFDAVGQIRLVAERLNLTQPAVSKQLAELEAGIGAPVLKRVGNRLFFTPLGEALLKRAREVFHQIEQARFEVDALTSGIHGKVSVGAVATVMPVFAPELVVEFKKRAPHVSVSLHEATSDRLFPMLSAGALDFVLSRTAPIGTAERFASRTLLDDPIVVVCGRDHPLAGRRKLVPADLAGLPWVLPPREAPTFVALSRWLERAGIALPDGCVQSISLEANAAMIASYPFLGLMPLSAARRAAPRALLTVLPLRGARFLSVVRLYYTAASANPVLPVALRCVAAVERKFIDGT
ncbi:LysR family transcriptional regulator [Chitinasiproducens palmae]|uniref:DNA-binding transcriptional regulator, LysR family n=1 Tax=Chitinasiproducens palmae TaxID=1770053 RepID=A0A1H2PK80_9BURK|nr:LysR family transcriptional regulator [Chitinasiproducens palmae]SDV46848.1 DNA-binding transcriptional regulator, LysR family [Chitinasiproducens palmae]